MNVSTPSTGAMVDPALVDAVRDVLVERGQPATPARVAAALHSLPGLRSDRDALALAAGVRAELAGAGPLQPLLADPQVSDVIVRAGGEVWVDRGSGLERDEIRLSGEQAVRRLATRLVASAGRRLDEAQPFADTTLPDGHRLHAALPPISVDGTCLALRTLRPHRFDLDGWTAGQPGEVAVTLRSILGAAVATVVTGPTGAGKTTLLGALIGALDPALRVLVVEDTTELRPRHPHVVRLQARLPNLEGAGGVPLRDLVRQALRMRPDRIVVGEVRGAEVVDLLVALNTGHAGGLCTLHANGASEVPARIEALGALAGLPRHAMHSLLGPALRVVVHVDRIGGRRAVRDVAVLVAGPDGIVRAVPALRVGVDGVARGPGYEPLRALMQR
ncbi:MAG TPA: TadA family conjugal transfer-associated ATPase [Mycobacteriales bacterium]|nr:TadA family conjugal transfer-associated ATPase [Mycobacteriales bacterium]